MNANRITATFTGIAFSDPQFPLVGDVNGTFTLKLESSLPTEKSWSERSKPDASGVARFIRVQHGLVAPEYYQIVMELSVLNPDGTINRVIEVFVAQAASLPLQNSLAYGGEASAAGL